MWVPTVYLKMTNNTWPKFADSFSEGTFQLLQRWLHSRHLIEPVACGMLADCGQLWLTGKLRTQPTTFPDRNMPPMQADVSYQGCLPSCKLHSRSLTVGHTGKVCRLRMWSWDCAHVLHNLQIASAIWGIWECATQSWDCANYQIAWNIYIKSL